MTDDIVSRLRNIYTLGQLGVVHEAANEIERLRAEILQINLLWNADKARLERLQRLNDCDMCSEITDYRCYEHRENTP